MVVVSQCCLERFDNNSDSAFTPHKADGDRD